MQRTLPWAAGLILIFVLNACHARPDDPKGQAKELSNPIRRENAIANLTRLYSQALQRHKSDRQNAEIKELTATICQPLVETYQNLDDVRQGLYILELLDEMQDACALPAFLKALKWRQGVNEEHAIRAARSVSNIELSVEQKKQAATALTESLGKVQGNRPLQNRIRIETLRAIGKIGDKSASPTLVSFMSAHKPDQDFLINRLAAEQLGRLHDPAVVPALIKGLFIYSPSNPMLRMNDVAAEALVRIGRPSLQPLLAVLRGENEEANALAEAYIKALAKRDRGAAAELNVRNVTASEASFTLGQLGLKEAVQPLMGELASADKTRRLSGMMAVIAISSVVDNKEPIRKALLSYYKEARKIERPQLIAAAQNTYDPELMGFFLEQAKQKENELPDIRFTAAQSYAVLANKQEAAALRPILMEQPSEDEPDYRQTFKQFLPMLDLAQRCDQEVSCWIKELATQDALAARKACAMLVRYASGQAAAVKALVEALRSGSSKTRGDILYALDHVAQQGSPEAVRAIDELSRKEEGSASWQQVKSLATVVQARLSHRAQR